MSEQALLRRVVTPFRMGAMLLALLVALVVSAHPAEAQRLVVHADHETGIYQPGEDVHWHVQWEGAAAAPATCRYVLKKGG
ncbi:MAG: hypothetical protein JWN14_423, partial [Chthonomonadales bacterium]|nr:hypothetical protein [Chthonomonadales bacterium]